MEMMKKIFKPLIKRLIKSSMARVMKYATLSRTGRHLFDQMLQAAMLHTRRVMHNGIELVFTVLNSLSLARVDSFSTKEPETLE